MAPYTTNGLAPPPNVSMKTIPMAGLLVDVYGLDELSATSARSTTCLWLLHPRTRTRERMRDIASRVLDTWNKTSGAAERGLIALTFDMPNHGTRKVSDEANGTWKTGNEKHAVDMMAMIKSARVEMSGLMDMVEGYLEDIRIDGHVCLGWSLGGHAAWQAWFSEPRLHAVVVVIGCANFMSLMSDRAKNSGFREELLGSKRFPNDLVNLCCLHDPKGILYGTAPLPSSLPLTAQERERLRSLLDERGLRDKKILLLSGADDPLVPYAHTRPLVKVLEDVGGVPLEDKVYDGVKHWFTADMVQDAVRFLVQAVEAGPRTASKI